MSLMAKAEAFLRAAPSNRREAIRTSQADALADLIVAYEERMAMVLEGGDVSEAEAHHMATEECGACIVTLCAELAAIAPHHTVFASVRNPGTRAT